MPTSSGRSCLRTLAIAAITAAASGTLVAGTAAPAAAAPATPVATNLATAQARLAALSDRIEQAVESYDAARIALDRANRYAAVAARRADVARRTFEAKRSMLTSYAVAAYQNDGAPPVALAVDGDPSRYLDRLSMLDEVSHRQGEIVRAVDVARAGYEQHSQAARHAADRAAEVAARIAATKRSIEAQIAQQRGIIAALRAEQARLQRIAAEKAAAARRAAAQRHAAAQRRAAAQQAAAAHAAARQAHAVAAVVSRATGPTHVRRHTATTHHDSTRHRVAVSGGAAAAVRAAYSALGRPYSWGASGPGSFDCSGLTMWAWAHAGVSLPHSSAGQYGVGSHVSRGQLRPGDLLFFYSPIHHVGMYVGGGQMIDAPHTGTVVSLRPVLWTAFVGATRP